LDIIVTDDWRRKIFVPIRGTKDTLLKRYDL